MTLRNFNFIQISISLKVCQHFPCTGKSFSEALILASINPQYDKRLFMVIPWTILSYCGLIEAKIKASDKDLPVHVGFISSKEQKIYLGTYTYI